MRIEQGYKEGGEYKKRWIEIDTDPADVEVAVLRAEHNAAIQAQLDAADIRAFRAFLEGDTPRIEAHKKAQAELRAKLRSLD